MGVWGDGGGGMDVGGLEMGVVGVWGDGGEMSGWVGSRGGGGLKWKKKIERKGRKKNEVKENKKKKLRNKKKEKMRMKNLDVVGGALLGLQSCVWELIPL